MQRALMPIMHRSDTVAYLPGPIFTAEDEAWAQKNHGQSLDGLTCTAGSERCGTSISGASARTRPASAPLMTTTFQQFPSGANENVDDAPPRAAVCVHLLVIGCGYKAMPKCAGGRVHLHHPH